MKLLFLHGAPAAGKLTVAKALLRLVPGRLMDNHAAIDLALRRMDLVITDPRSREAGKAKLIDPNRGEQGLGGLGGLGRAESTGADRRAQRSKGREKNKQDFRQKRKEKGKG